MERRATIEQIWPQQQYSSKFDLNCSIKSNVCMHLSCKDHASI